MYSFNLSENQLQTLNIFGINFEVFKEMFGTIDIENINDSKTGFLSGPIFDNTILSLNRFILINKLLMSMNLYGKVAQCYRSQKTFLRLKKEGLNPSLTSQHFDSEAIDVHVYQKESRIRSSSNKAIFDDIIEILRSHKGVLQIIQLRVYDWGFHIGFESKKGIIKPSIVDTRG
jgi:hypothetical protein